MYVRMYDDLIKGSDDAPTIGVLLCTDTDNTIARYSVLHDNNQLFAAKYMTYMPTEEELRKQLVVIYLVLPIFAMPRRWLTHAPRKVDFFDIFIFNNH